MGTFGVKMALAEISFLVLYGKSPFCNRGFRPATTTSGHAYLIPTNRMKQKKRAMEETILDTGITDHRD